MAGFRDFLYHSVPPCPSCRLCSCLLCSSTLGAFVSSWLRLNYAKQTQFPKPKNRRNLLCRKDLLQYTATPTRRKTNPNKPNLSRRNPPGAGRSRNKPNLSRRSLWRSRIPRDTQYAIRHPPAPWQTCEIRNTLHASRDTTSGLFAGPSSPLTHPMAECRILINYRKRL